MADPKTSALLIIDAQYDFCHPEGALYVPGAADDIKRLAAFIRKNAEKIDHITVTLDTHPVHDISHPQFWMDNQGNSPAPFTQITLAEVQEGKWVARNHLKEALQYLTELEAQGEFPHFIWPEHCLQGSRGNALDDTLMEALLDWGRSGPGKTGNDYRIEIKGTNPFTEHFGIFKAQVPLPHAPETQLNRSLINTLQQYDQVYLAGEAQSHCVATSLKQAMDYAPDLAAKMVILSDAMSDVAGLGHLGLPIYEAARRLGIRFTTTEQKIER
jgi:nicotinamidase-related amidase